MSKSEFLLFPAIWRSLTQALGAGRPFPVKILRKRQKRIDRQQPNEFLPGLLHAVVGLWLVLWMMLGLWTIAGLAVQRNWIALTTMIFALGMVTASLASLVRSSSPHSLPRRAVQRALSHWIQMRRLSSCPRLLLVENAGPSAHRLENALACGIVPKVVCTAPSVMAACVHLDHAWRYPSQRPHLIILGGSLPAQLSLFLLQHVKSTPELSHIPVLLLTSSPAHPIFARAYAQGAAACLAVPQTIEEMADFVGAIERRWLSSRG